LQVSVWVHALPSLHVAPLALSGLLHTPFVGLQVPTSWHCVSAVQVTGLLPWQTPAWQVSVCVQPLPSEQAVLLGFCGLEHTPVLGLHVPGLWHCDRAVQITGFPPVHDPLLHVSLCVHALPSSQALPVILGGLEQMPVAGLHVPASWHCDSGVQVVGVPAMQVPSVQASPVVQALPSLQAAPFGFSGFVHTPVEGLHVPGLWHWDCAEHTTALPPTQPPPWQVSV
jgi:hypothetical protein